MLMFLSLSLSMRRILSFCRDIHCYYIHTEGTITSPQEKALRPLFHSFSPSLAFIFVSCWHPSILSAVLSLQFFVSVFHSVSFVFFFLSVIHLCPLPSPSRNIKKTTMREHFKHALFTVKVLFTCRQHGSV